MSAIWDWVSDASTGAWDWLQENPSVAGAVLGGLAGSQGTQGQTTTQAPYMQPGQQEGLANFINLSQQQYQAGPQQFYPGQQIASLDPNVIQGQNMALGSAPIMQQLADTGAMGVGQLLNGGAGMVDGFSLPGQVGGSNFTAGATQLGDLNIPAPAAVSAPLALPGQAGTDAPQLGGLSAPGYEGWGIDQGLQDAVTNPIMRNLQERVLPGLNLQATSQGAFGGSRHSQMMGQAAASATGQMSEALANANLQARGQDINQRGQDINMAVQGRGQDLQARGQDINSLVQNRGQDVNALVQGRGQDVNALLQNRGQDINAMVQGRGQNLQARGQDINANVQGRAQDIGQRTTDINAMLQGRGQDITQSQIYNDALRSGASLLPEMISAQMAPSAIYSQVGRDRTNYNQTLIDADRQRFDFNQQAGIDAIDRLGQRMNLTPGGTVTNVPGYDGNWASVLGGALGGVSLLNQFRQPGDNT